MNLIQHRVAALVGVLGLACSSTSSAPGDGAAILVTLRNFRTGERFELASESHTDRVIYYSDPRNDAVRKVQTDEVMSAFVGEIDRLGFGDHAQPGPAPAVASGEVIRWGLELESGAKRSHWLVGTSSPGGDWQEFQACRDTFLELYNYTVSFQTVQNERGRSFFEEAEGSAPEKPR